MSIIPLGDMATATLSTSPSVPSPAIHRLKMSAGSGSTLTDSIGTEDATNNASWVSGTYQGGNAVSASGTHVSWTTLGSFGSDLVTDFAIGFTFQTSTTPNGGTALFGDSSDASGGASSGGTQIELRYDSGTDAVFRLRDLDGDTISQKYTLPSAADNSTKHRYLFNKTSNADSGLELYQDTTACSGTVKGSGTFDNVKDFDVQPVQLFRTKFNGGFDTDYLNGILDDVIIYNDSLTSGQIADDYNIQPWT